MEQQDVRHEQFTQISSRSERWWQAQACSSDEASLCLEVQTQQGCCSEVPLNS